MEKRGKSGIKKVEEEVLRDYSEFFAVRNADLHRSKNKDWMATVRISGSLLEGRNGTYVVSLEVTHLCAPPHSSREL